MILSLYRTAFRPQAIVPLATNLHKITYNYIRKK